jgi:hypothetical protein
MERDQERDETNRKLPEIEKGDVLSGKNES